MKKLILAFLLSFTCLSAFADYVGDPRFPTFTKHGIKFQCSIQDEFGSITVLQWNGAAWQSWGGAPDINGTVSDWYDDDMIISHGGVRSFLVWVAGECEKRAEAHVALPLPNPLNRPERFNYAMKMLLKVVPDAAGVDHIVVPPPPLP